MTFDDSYNLRPCIETDINFILNSWCSCIRRLLPFNWMDKDVFRKHHDLIVDTVNLSDIIIACPDEDKDHIYGWIAAMPEKGICHFIYVGKIWRQRGIARRLFNAVFDKYDRVFYTHQTMAAMRVAAKYRATFDPYLLEKANGKISAH